MWDSSHTHTHHTINQIGVSKKSSNINVTAIKYYDTYNKHSQYLVRIVSLEHGNNMDKYNNHGDITLGQPIDKQDFNRPYKKNSNL